MRRQRIGFLGAMVVFLGVGCQGRETEEARSFLAAYAAVDHREPEAVRRPRISALSGLVLTNTAIAATRDECVKAHLALLDSEVAQERAAQALDEALRGDAGSAPLPVSQTAPIQAVIDTAERALREAKKSFAVCEEEARNLSLRFGKH